MSLKSTYRTFTSWLLLIMMIWNVAGWLGIGLTSMISHHAHSAEHTCEVTLCYCEVEDGEKICTCHHPELQGLAHAEHETSQHVDYSTHEDGSKNSSSHSVCYYASPHTNSSGSIAIAVLDKVQTVLNIETNSDQSFTPVFTSRSIDNSLLTGHSHALLRPPRA